MSPDDATPDADRAGSDPARRKPSRADRPPIDPGIAGDPAARQAAYTGTRPSWIQRRRDKVMAEIERNRRGEYKVPTWVLVVLLVAMVAGWIAIIVFN